jgi:hypothetical protein
MIGPRRSRLLALAAAATLAATGAACTAATSSSSSGPTAGAGGAGANATTTTSAPGSTSGSAATTVGSRHHSPGPAALRPLPPPAALGRLSLAGSSTDGQWRPAGRLVGGHPAVYETTLVPPGSTLEAGIAWMDTHLLRAQLYSGSLSPGGGPWRLTAPISAAAAKTLVAVFNGGFKFPAANGGYYAEGKLAFPLRVGDASLVIYRDGAATVGRWGRDVSMSQQVIAVRQNLTLLVDNGQPVPGLNPNDSATWGATLGGGAAVWRSGVGVTRDGALVYVMGPGLEITQLAALLVRAGCMRAMTLDMNPDWTEFATYVPAPTAAAAVGLPGVIGTSLLTGTVQSPATFFQSWWARDFVTMSAR